MALNLDIEEIPLKIDEAQTENIGTNIEGLELLTNKSIEHTNISSSLDELEKTLNETVNNDTVNNDTVDKDNFFSDPVTQTWDGFAKVNSLPEPIESKFNKEDELHEKFKYMRLLEELEKKGVSLRKRYDMESSLLEMKGEYETIIREKEKSNSVKFQGKMLMAAITGMEFMNNKFDPFDIHLDGWGEQVNENLQEYDDIFGELHEKYKSKGKLAPEIKLMFQLAGSAIMIHMSNTLLKSAMPGMDDIMRQNPDLMQQFTKAAVDQMSSNNNNGFGNFMEMANNNNRPDLRHAKGDESMGEPVERSHRAEMKGPEDISDILSGLKIDEKDTEKSNKKSNRKMKNTMSLNL